MLTRGAVLHEVGAQWQVEEIEVGDPAAGEVHRRAGRLRPVPLRRAPGHRGHPGRPCPVLGGHEGAGVVDQGRSGVTGLRRATTSSPPSSPPAAVPVRARAAMQNLCDLGASLLAGTSISDGSYRLTAPRPGVVPMCLLGHVLAVHRPCTRRRCVKIEHGHPAGDGRARRLRRHHRLGFGDQRRPTSGRATRSSSWASAASASTPCRARPQPARRTSSPSTRCAVQARVGA